ncbi:hypothetical protein D3C81_09680 [compost metagenome]
MRNRLKYWLNADKTREYYKIKIPIFIDSTVFDILIAKYGEKATMHLLAMEYIGECGEHASLFKPSKKYSKETLEKAVTKFTNKRENVVIFSAYDEGEVEAYLNELEEGVKL